MAKPSRRGLRPLLLGCGVAALAALVYVGVQVRPFVQRGFLDQENVAAYQATREGNLKALRIALMAYHDSEGHFPYGPGWMDAIQNRLRAGDQGNWEAKLVDPALRGAPGQFGFALNDAFAGKYVDDVPDRQAAMVFTSKATERNAHGDPAELLPTPPRGGINLGVAADGTVGEVDARGRVAPSSGPAAKD